MKPIQIKLKEKTALSLDGVNSKDHKKGEVLTSKSSLQHRLFEHLIESGKADPVVSDEPDKKQGKKVAKPKETKKRTTKTKK